MPPFADPDNASGFEIELAREVVARLFGDITVLLVRTGAAERFMRLEDGAFDMLIRTTSHTTSREELAAPTAHYFVDGLAVVVRADSDLTSVADLDDARLAVANSASFGGGTFEGFLETSGLAVVASEVDNAEAGFGRARLGRGGWGGDLVRGGTEPGSR